MPDKTTFHIREAQSNGSSSSEAVANKAGGEVVQADDNSKKKRKRSSPKSASSKKSVEVSKDPSSLELHSNKKKDFYDSNRKHGMQQI